MHLEIILTFTGNIYKESGDLMLTSVLRTLILYCLIITAIRIMGKRQIGDMQTSELVVTLLIADIAAIPMENTSKPLLSGVIPILILVACEIVLSIVMLKKTRFRRLICGKPIIVINNGKICQAEMKRLRMTTEDLFEQLRQNEVFSLGDVLYAIVETNGKMSIMRNPQAEPPSCKILNMKAHSSGMEVVIVSDGVISNSSCKLYGISRKDIDKQLQKNNTELNNVFIMTVDKDNNYKIIERDNSKI